MKARPLSIRAFSLVEVLVSMSLAGVVLAAILSSFVFLGRNLVRLANYQALETKGREALTHLRRDVALAESVKTATAPSSHALTLVLPAGEVTYRFDPVSGSLRREATGGPNPDLRLLRNDRCACTTFTFVYQTSTGGDPASQLDAAAIVPYGIKRILIRFVLETPGDVAAGTRTTYAAVSGALVLRNKQAATGI